MPTFSLIFTLFTDKNPSISLNKPKITFKFAANYKELCRLPIPIQSEPLVELVTVKPTRKGNNSFSN